MESSCQGARVHACVFGMLLCYDVYMVRSIARDTRVRCGVQHNVYHF